MTSTATRDKQGKFAKTPEVPAPRDLFDGFDAADSLLAAARMAADAPPVFFREGELDAGMREAAEAVDGAIGAESRGFDDNYRRALGCKPAWTWYRASLAQAPDAYAGCGDAAEPPAVLVASRPLGELEPDDQERLDAFHAAAALAERAEQASHWRLVHRDPRPTPPGFPAVSEGWDGPQDVPGPGEDTRLAPQEIPGPGTATHEPRQADEALDEAQQEESAG